VRDDHRERRLVSLPVRERARAQDRLAVRSDLDVTELALGEPVRDLHVGAEPDPHLPRASLGAPAPLLLPQAVVIRCGEGALERTDVIARVVGRA